MTPEGQGLREQTSGPATSGQASSPSGPAPWERQFGESKDAYLLFAAYRDLGPERSLARLVEAGESSVGVRQLEKYSSRHHWAQRSDAWDVEQERIRRERAGERQAKIDERITAIAERTLKAVEERAQLWAEHGLSNTSPTEVMKVMETVVKLQRLVAGEATSINQESPRTFDQYIRDLQASGFEPSWH
jgi:hypothetical protein